MKKPTPAPVGHVRSFEAAARHLSFSRAAEELGYTQAAISGHVRSLEKYIGRPLFLRHARSIELTEAGEALLPSLRQALQQIDMATDAVVQSARAGSVVIACPISLADSWLPGVLARFRARAPGIEVLVHGTVWDRPGTDPADIVISVHRDDEVPANCRRLIAEELVLVCAPALAEGLAGPADALGLPRIEVAGRQDLFARFARRHGLAEGAPGGPPIGTNSSNIALELAAAGLGATMALGTLARPFLASGRLVAPFGTAGPSPWSYHLALPSARPSSAVRMLADMLLEAGAA